MKKKIFTLFAAIGFSLTLSTSAFALNNNLAQEVDGYSTPLNNYTFQQDHANPFYGINDWYHGTFSSYDDHDYFYWKNDTGSTKLFYVYFDVNYNGVNNNYLDYGVRSIGTTGIGAGATRVYKETGRELWQINLPANEELKVHVAATYYSKVDPNAHYQIILSNGPIF